MFRTFPDPSRWRPTAMEPSPRARRGVLVDANRGTVARPAGGIRQLELDFSAVSAVGRQRHLGRDPGSARRKRVVRHHAANDRCDHHPGASLCRRWKRGTERNALGRSRGGFSTKINARTNAEGLPIGKPSALVRALILVEKPPRERPRALRTVPPFHRPRTPRRDRARDGRDPARRRL